MPGTAIPSTPILIGPKGVKLMKLNLLLKVVIVFAMTIAVKLRFRKGP
jgi:hypothetical protein